MAEQIDTLRGQWDTKDNATDSKNSSSSSSSKPSSPPGDSIQTMQEGFEKFKMEYEEISRRNDKLEAENVELKRQKKELQGRVEYMSAKMSNLILDASDIQSVGRGQKDYLSLPVQETQREEKTSAAVAEDKENRPLKKPSSTLASISQVQISGKPDEQPPPLSSKPPPNFNPPKKLYSKHKPVNIHPSFKRNNK